MLNKLKCGYINSVTFGNFCFGFAVAVVLCITALFGKLWLFVAGCCGVLGLVQLFKWHQPANECTGFGWGSLYLLVYAFAWLSEHEPNYLVFGSLVIMMFVGWPVISKRFGKPQWERKWLRWLCELGEICCGLVGLWAGLLFCAHVGAGKIFAAFLILFFLFYDVLLKLDEEQKSLTKD